MELSVVILNYNAAPFLRLCLNSVIAATQNIESEIIVADNNSQDNSLRMLQMEFPQVKALAFDKNFGFSKGNNLAVQKASGRFLCILNPDTIVGEEVFDTCLAFAKARTQKKQSLGFLGVRLIDGSGNFLPESKRHIPTPKVARQKLLGNDEFYYFNEVLEKDRGAVEVLVGAFMFCEKSVYEDCGGFDERYFMYGEDIDLSYMALQKGYQNYYLGDVNVIHFKGESTVKNKKYYDRFYGAMELFYLKYFKRSAFEKLITKAAVKSMVTLKSFGSTEVQTADIEQVFVTESTNESRFQGKKTVSLKDEGDLTYSQLVFDTNHYKYQELIDFISQRPNIFQYRFLDKKQQQIVGSDSSINQGVVEDFQ
ncbi:MAG: glycosyltransferase family 2 protein [Nonlabens sp.]